MKCPLLVVEDIHCHDNQLTDPSDCLKQECAWWVTDIQLCAVRDIAIELHWAQLRLADIRENMPHELRFRKK